MAREYDAIVVGGGPSGSTAANFLGKAGFKVLLVDKAKFPRDKTCGDAVSGKSRSVLAELALDAKLQKVKEKADVTGIIFSSPNGSQVEIDYAQGNKELMGFVCRRVVLDNILFKEASKVCETIQEFQVSDAIEENGRIVGVKGTGKDGRKKEFRAKVIIGADGATSMLARKLGFSEQDPKNLCVAIRTYYTGVTGMTSNIELHFVDSMIPGYFWIFPVGNGLTNVGAGVLASEIKKRKINLPNEMDKVIKESRFFKDRFKNAKMVEPVKGWNLPLGPSARKLAGKGLLLVGDAASLIDPFSGEGMGNAMYSGRLAAKVAIKCLKKKDFSDEALSEYEKQLRQSLDAELRTSAKLLKWAKYGFLVDFVIGKAARSKWVRDQISGTFVDREAKGEFADPLFYLRLLFA
jgi:geranylgeranyl reductase family protein